MARVGALALTLALALPLVAPPLAAQVPLELTDPVHVTALAVALTEAGDVVGASADVSVSVARGGSGHVFIDTRPLAGTDMQGSARIAARVAAALTGYPLEAHDLFFVIRSDSPIIAGPSAGGIMALAAAVALHNANAYPTQQWELDPAVMATGTIGPDGTIGPVGGILEKAQAAQRAGATLFLVPEGQGVVSTVLVQGGVAVATEPVDVSDHCTTELHITCREVGTLEDLLELATGQEILHDEPDRPPSTADYFETLGPLSATLVRDARAYRDVWADLNASDVSTLALEQITLVLEAADNFSREAQEHYEAQRFYSAASRAFSASIQGTLARLLLDYFESGRSLDELEDAVRDAHRIASEAERAAARASVTGMHTLYTVGAAQERVSEAQARVARAWERINASDVGGGLEEAAWAMERSETVHWWLSLVEHFGDGRPLPVPVEQLADEFIDLADEALAYTTEVLQGATPGRAAEQLARAKADDRRGFHAAAVIEAAESQVLAALAIELVAGTVTPAKIDTSREQAARAINDARSDGVEPVLAVAMFEFGGTQVEAGEPDLALEFYRNARVFAGLSKVLGTSADPAESRFVGHWEEPLHGGGSLPRGAYRAVALGWFAIGVFAMAAMVALVAAFVERSKGH